MTTKATIAGLAFGFLLLGVASEAAAQYYRPAPQFQRWGYRHRPHGFVGGQLMGFAVAGESTEYTNGYLGHGGGGGLFGGARLSPYFSIEGNWMMTFHNETFESADVVVVDLDSVYMMSFTIDGKVHIPTRGPVEPFFQLGVGYAFIGANYNGGVSGDTVFAGGPAFNAGGGLDFWLARWVSVGGRLLYRGLYFGKPHYEGTRGRYANFVSGVSLDGNLTFHF